MFHVNATSRTTTTLEPCTSLKCLQDSGCVGFHDFLDGSMGPSVDSLKCSSSGTRFDENELCWQNKINDEKSLIITHMQKGFNMGQWWIQNHLKGDQQEQISSGELGKNQLYLAIQGCEKYEHTRSKVVVENVDDISSDEPPHDFCNDVYCEDCHVALRSEGSLIQVLPYVSGDFVSYWKQGLMLGEKTVATTSLKFSIYLLEEVYSYELSGYQKPNIYIIHQTTKLISSDLQTNRFSPHWSQIVHHFHINASVIENILQVVFSDCSFQQ